MSDLKELNRVYNSINLGKFYDENYCDYAIYRALQRIPNLVDGFAQTQRKIIYTMINKSIDKKTKVSDLAAVVSLHTKYHHGSGSIETAISNLVPVFNNQVPLIKEDGTYGNRSDRGAAAPRYVETRLFKYSKVMFNSIDNTNFVEDQKVEGQKIEPKTMIPIIPLLLVNGQSQIGVGYSCDILPRDIKVILKILKDILSSKRKDIPTSIPPISPMFKGTIFPHPKGGWGYKGIVEEGPKNTVIISEVPPTYTRESYMNILEALKESGKIKSYNENILGDDFNITVKMPLDWTKIKVKDKEARVESLIKMFKLTSKKSENITIINTKDQIIRYDNIAEVFFEYIMFVLDIYKKRKQYLLDKKIKDSQMNREKIRFITDVNNDKIILKNKKRLIINDNLKLLNYQLFDNSYDYLLNMRIVNLTSEKIIELENTIKKVDKEYDSLKDVTVATIWLNDLIEFEKFLKNGE